MRPFAPGAESWADFTLRVARVLDRIQREYAERTVVLFTHGGIIDTSFLVFFGMPTLYVPNAHFFTYNTAITQWQLGNRDGRDRWRLVRYNDDLHTRDIGTAERIGWPRGLRAPEQDRAWPAVPLPTEDAEAEK